MYWAKKEGQPKDVKQIIVLVRQSYPDIRWTRLNVMNPGADDDGVWFFWLTDRPGEVQIESSYGVCPFLIETDKHDKRLDGTSVQQVAKKILEWLAIPSEHEDYFRPPDKN